MADDKTQEAAAARSADHADFLVACEIMKRSGDPSTRAYARLIERLVPVVVDWWNAEGSTSGHEETLILVNALGLGLGCAAGAALRTVTPEGEEHKAAGDIGRLVIEAIVGGLRSERDPSSPEAQRVAHILQSGSA